MPVADTQSLDGLVAEAIQNAIQSAFGYGFDAMVFRLATGAARMRR